MIGYIYKISCVDENITDFYIGSTFDFEGRKLRHKAAIKTRQSPVYKFIRNNGGYDNFKFDLLESFDMVDKNELHRCERIYIKAQKPSLNYNIPLRSSKEYYKDNHEKICEYKKQYFIDNKESILAKKKVKYAQNPEFYIKKASLYYHKNKEALTEKRKVKNEKLKKLKNKEENVVEL